MKEFYIGYLPKMPESFVRFVRPFVIVVLIAAVVFGIVFLIGQKPFARSFFEFGQVRDFEGTIQARPVPFLLVEKPEKNNGLPAFKRYPLVGEFKHGVGERVAALDGRRVKLKGTRIYRDDLEMIEVVGDSVEAVGEGVKTGAEQTESLGKQTLKGEIVDSKCYLGVMNPGASKPHRECAVACLRGGIPALFIVKDERGNTSELWLLSEKGEPVNQQILDFVAEPIEITGEVKRTGDMLFFYADPQTIGRL